MKHALLFLTFLFFITTIRAAHHTARVSHRYAPYHQFLYQNNGVTTLQGGNGFGQSRATVYKQIGHRHDLFVDSNSTWTGVDSGRYSYTPNAREKDETLLAYSSEWDNTIHRSFTYDGNDNQLSELGQNWIAYQDSFRNNYRYSYVYSNNDQVNGMTELWDTVSNAWLFSSKATSTYSNHHILTYLSQNWDSSASKWVDNYRYLFQNDVNGNDTLETDQQWNGSAWVNTYQYIYKYDSDGNYTLEIDQQWNGTDWDNTDKYTDEYDAFGSDTLTTGYYWNSGDLNWENAYREVMAYTLTHKIEADVAQNWDNEITDWVNSEETLYTYNGDDLPSQGEEKTWDTESGWLPLRRFTVTYDNNGNRIYELDEKYESGYKNDQRFYFYYESYEVAGINPLINELKACLYPNPSTSQVHLQLELAENENLDISIYNLQGQLVLTQKRALNSGNNLISLDGAEMPAGIYFIRVDDKHTGISSVLKWMRE